MLSEVSVRLSMLRSGHVTQTPTKRQIEDAEDDFARALRYARSVGCDLSHLDRRGQGGEGGK